MYPDDPPHSAAPMLNVHQPTENQQVTSSNKSEYAQTTTYHENRTKENS